MGDSRVKIAYGGKPAECDICQREGHSAKVSPKRGKYLKCDSTEHSGYSPV